MELGPRRLAALGIIGVAVLLTIGLGAYVLGRPQMDVLYTGLERDDVARVGSTLTDNGIAFDVNAKGDAVLVPPSLMIRARMILAEHGLPQSANAGYELFDHLGSLGLTSFMQEVTRVRALEGEIARTIQSMKGIRAARVHLVMADPGSFRQEAQKPSASVVIRVETADGISEAQAIRHLVASAVPGMSVDRVTVLSSDGTLLVAGDGAKDATAGQSVTLERKVAKEVEENIRRTLTPYLGLDNFQISVAAKLNTDRKQIKETIFNPDSKVERSVRSVRENQNNQNSSRQKPTTVEQNLPDQQVSAAAYGGNQSAEESQRREELTNYELSSKVVQTTSDGYGIENLSVAVLVNREQIAASLGKSATPEAIADRLKEIQDIATAAAGAKSARGDVVQVSAVDFTASGSAMAPEPGLNLMQLLMRQSGTLINAATILAVAGMLIWFGLRPAVNTILEHRKATADQFAAEAQMLEGAAAGMTPEQLAVEAERKLGSAMEQNLIEDLTNKLAHSPIKRLEQMVQLNEEQAVNILKQWMHAEEA
jgi:flagellar M-ring protein FliF